ncbi:LacI family transcriptional regulator [Actibacterium mucosum KCTC 23349]|uniref:LacI family transcriptional regulator n=1 Tax=Actibacterium mucosum KCTC 23349 TaxID=1454373 RepID=A0A037ZGG3_9RHOB|nr:LacI family DNA-binding transcriptional regulator [Actibacterium mucosum]KAJ54626.1 LacI family transcriptional regulator [Actibacterium mucosum KCTC 23349]
MSKEKSSNNKKISLAEVARAAGVSKMTASRVLRDQGGFSESTRQKVMAEVERLGYLPNRMATAFAAGESSPFIGVSIPDLRNEAFAQILEGIDHKLGTFGHQTVLGLSRHLPEEEEKWIEKILSWQPAGLILTGRVHSPRAITMLKNAAIPVVEMWDLNSSPLDMCVGLNHFDSGYQMGRFLIEKGHRKLGYVGTDHGVANAAQSRWKGFAKAVQDGGGEVCDHHCLNDVPDFYPGYYGTEQLLNAHPGVQAIFFQNDNMAVGGYEFCEGHGLRIPDDIGIVGWGALPVLSVFRKKLTTVKVRHVRLGQLAAEKLLSTLHGSAVQPVSDVGYLTVPGATA